MGGWAGVLLYTKYMFALYIYIYVYACVCVVCVRVCVCVCVCVVCGCVSCVCTCVSSVWHDLFVAFVQLTRLFSFFPPTNGEFFQNLVLRELIFFPLPPSPIFIFGSSGDGTLISGWYYQSNGGCRGAGVRGCF